VRLEVVAGEPMGGYADRVDGVLGTLDPLEVHAVTFADGGHRFALVVADLVCVNSDVVERVREAGRSLGVDTCWVAATHTHASPESGCVPGGTTTPPDLAARLVTSACSAMELALSDERRSAVSATRVRVSGLGGRRNVADAPVELPVDAIVVSEDDAVRGLIVVSPVHPTVLSSDNRAVSADLTGGIRRALRGGDHWVVVATGAAGDISTRHTRRGRGADEVDRLGAMVAEALTIDALRPDPHDRSALGAPIARALRLVPKDPTELDRIAPPTADGAEIDHRSHQVMRQGERIAADLAVQARTEPYTIEIESVRLGGATVVAVPAELFLALGESIRAAVPASEPPVIVLGYANGYLGYLTDGEVSPTYESLVSPVQPDSGRLVAQAAIELVTSSTQEEQG